MIGFSWNLVALYECILHCFTVCDIFCDFFYNKDNHKNCQNQIYKVNSIIGDGNVEFENQKFFEAVAPKVREYSRQDRVSWETSWLFSFPTLHQNWVYTWNFGQALIWGYMSHKKKLNFYGILWHIVIFTPFSTLQNRGQKSKIIIFTYCMEKSTT